MATSELIIFKKDTDAPGSNRGFIYQYLKTLLLWLDNYQKNENITIYCEVDDDIKEINLMEQTVRFTQLKCYSTALNINSEEIKKSLYNYFLLHLIYEGYDGEYVFETNTHISKRDTTIEKWMELQGNLGENQVLQKTCVSKTKEMLLEIFEDEKKSMEKAIQKKIATRNEKTNNAPLENEEMRIEIEKLNKELEIIQNLSKNFKSKIDNDNIMEDFTNRIRWIFESIEAVQSIEVLKEKANEALRNFSKDESRVDLYFGRLLTEINFKAVKEKREHRFLDNQLLGKILNETDDVIRLGIDKAVLKEFDILSLKIGQEFSGLNQNISDSENRIRNDINSWGTRLEHQFQSTTSDAEYYLYEMPRIEPEEVEEFIEKENNQEQSRLEMKFNKIEGIDKENRNNLLQTATELRCRYLLYIQMLSFQNFHREYDEIKKLEKKIEDICNDAVLELQMDNQITSASFYLRFKKELKLALKEFNSLVKIKKFNVDLDIVYGQMFHMAAKCFLRWHRER
ncbi:hypothetical protein QLH48_09920 [Bacillus safensis]|uniref:hypothetical protein n=1 Tax=Bacillus TaxID=1386 RepID=UPI000F76BBE6|nr:MULTISPECIES: hypothetical protein [Bacillus]MCM3367667.1 hypothetical protein [Bacillus safensis]MDJ0290776.1 hypothetical protein [Bacillus safensis]NMW02430.1 hypothetical protein [Bacillus safensis]